jgi:hypothetical protein
LFFVPVLLQDHAFTIRNAIEGIDLMEGIDWFIVIVSAIVQRVGGMTELQKKGVARAMDHPRKMMDETCYFTISLRTLFTLSPTMRT